MPAGRLLGFIVSKDDITLDPLKVQAILELPIPRNLRQLQSLQGKANFLRRFVPDVPPPHMGSLDFSAPISLLYGMPMLKIILMP